MNLNNTQYWQVRAQKIETDIGKWIGGKDVTIRSYSLFNDLFCNVSYMQLHVLNVTGKLISKELSTWLENNFMVMSYPDSRIWCNQIGALCGVMGTTPAAGIVAGTLAADSRVYGGSQTSKYAMTFLISALKSYSSGKTIPEIVNELPLKQGKPAIIGFARPINRSDERIEPHRKMSKNLGFEDGDYMSLANKLDAYVSDNYGLGINIGGYTAAFMLDQGFSADELYNIKAICVNSGVAACFIDNLQHTENAYLPLKCTDIEYTGPSYRKLK